MVDLERANLCLLFCWSKIMHFQPAPFLIKANLYREKKNTKSTCCNKSDAECKQLSVWLLNKKYTYVSETCNLNMRLSALPGEPQKHFLHHPSHTGSISGSDFCSPQWSRLSIHQSHPAQCHSSAKSRSFKAEQSHTISQLQSRAAPHWQAFSSHCG